ncbi:MAG: deoxyribodipyrimidine photo-lyase [Anaerolineales bacterium]|nr:deoxyribodipyrimidine photo-lyase [Anaerolineales bacterium]
MTSIWWIRRDLRLHDNLTLHAALAHGAVVPLFVIDPHFELVSNRRRGFLVNNLHALNADLQARGSRLFVRSGAPAAVLHQVMAETGASRVFAEEDFTPYARSRDDRLQADLPIRLIQGQIVHHPLAISKPDGTPYTVYTPFSKTWKGLLPPDLRPVQVPERIPTPASIPSESLPEYPPEPNFPTGESEALHRLEDFLSRQQGIFRYDEDRNRMDLDGTSSLSPYLHLGVLGLRTAVYHALQSIQHAPDKSAHKSATTWLNELIWREFYIHILYHFPHVRGGSFRPEYDGIRWHNDPIDFEAWTEGRTGYPVVDAAMRQLLATGWMHNRARMITASFLVKDLLIDWRRGERWFMQNLLDADLAANNGGWQWTAGTGTDAAPYFRIFNPILQSKKFDPNGDYIRRWVPELAGLSPSEIHAPWERVGAVPGYPEPVVDHQFARERTLAAYRTVKG